MKEIQIDDLTIGDEVSIHLPGNELGLNGTYAGLIFDHQTRVCSLEIMTPFGVPVELPTKWRPLIYRIRKARAQRKSA